MKKYLFALLLALAFFLIQFFTLPDYGVSWDEALHFMRGQAYLHYFLTGRLSYADLNIPDLDSLKGNQLQQFWGKRSLYQSDVHNGEFFVNGVSEKKIGHPPLNDDLAATLNYVFFQKLGIVSDITSYHLFNIFASSILVFIVTVFALETFGVLAGVVSFLSLVTYPLFFSEAHFNIKDPIEAAFFAGSIWAFYKLMNSKRPRWIAILALFLGLAIGTKFNILFLPFILCPYILFSFPQIISAPLEVVKKVPLRFYIWGILGILLAGGLFFISWPSLWSGFPKSLIYVLKYYRDIGTGYNYQPDNYYFLGFNLYPLLWIIFTTPPVVLTLSVLGVISTFFVKGNKRNILVLWFVWLLIPILRVTLPKASIYGGDRQIMEFIPAMALLSGAGAWGILKCIKEKSLKNIVALLLVLVFIYPAFVLVKMYPNQNVYFNSLIGGLKGASEQNFPSWGNSLGNAYKQGTDWLNKNAEKSAKVALIQGTKANAPLILFRPDIDYDITNFSGMQRGGEYLMELVFNDTGKAFYYRWEYVDNFLEPVYEVKVDGVVILKIWKNDLAHTKSDHRFTEQLYKGDIKVNSDDHFLILSADEKILLSKISINLDDSCRPIGESYIETSIDGKIWTKEKDPVSSDQLVGIRVVSDNTLNFLFAGREARFIRISFEKPQLCKLSTSDIKFMVLK